MLKVDMGLQIVLCFADIGLLLGCVGQKLLLLYNWIAMTMIFIVLTIAEAIVATKALEPSTTLTIVTILAVIDILASFWTILVVIGAIKDIKILRKIPYY